ncbi:uncharacterized protein FFNC_15718 [Fusarium fujikuroi]|nr:uncharacterized protein FFNC_15718 [Fusarium fujikuroi]
MSLCRLSDIDTPYSYSMASPVLRLSPSHPDLALQHGDAVIQHHLLMATFSTQMNRKRPMAHAFASAFFYFLRYSWPQLMTQKPADLTQIKFI